MIKAILTSVIVLSASSQALAMDVKAAREMAAQAFLAEAAHHKTPIGKHIQDEREYGETDFISADKVILKNLKRSDIEVFIKSIETEINTKDRNDFESNLRTIKAAVLVYGATADKDVDGIVTSEVVSNIFECTIETAGLGTKSEKTVVDCETP